MDKSGNFYEQVYKMVRQIPAGQVSSYGRIARMLGRPRAARAVGYALNALKDKPDGDIDPVPWQRIVNAAGRVSIVNREWGAAEQVRLLRSEGVQVDNEHRITNFEAVLWEGVDYGFDHDPQLF